MVQAARRRGTVRGPSLLAGGLRAFSRERVPRQLSAREDRSSSRISQSSDRARSLPVPRCSWEVTFLRSVESPLIPLVIPSLSLAVTPMGGFAYFPLFP